MEDKIFQTRLCTAQCEYGSIKDQYINIPLDHGVYFQDADHPLLNANDHKADEHILQFGRCTSKANPKNAVADVASKIIPLFGLVSLLKSAMKCEGCKCSPKTLTAWYNTNSKDHLDGVDGLTNASKVMCFYGGTITINKVDDNGTDSTTSTDSDTTVQGDSTSSSPGDGGPSVPKSPMERMPAGVAAGIEKNNIGMQNYANNMNTSIPEVAMDSDGFLVDSSALACFSCGTSNLAESGSACIASYNASVALGSEVPLAEMILANDILLPQESNLSEQMIAMSEMFEAMGFSTKKKKTFDEVSIGAVALMATKDIKTGKASFNSFSSNKEGKFTCLEHRKKEKDFLAFEKHELHEEQISDSLVGHMLGENKESILLEIQKNK